MTALPRPGRRLAAGVALTLGLSAPVSGCAAVTTAAGENHGGEGGDRAGAPVGPGPLAREPQGGRCDGRCMAATPGGITIAAVGDINPPGNRHRVRHRPGGGVDHGDPHDLVFGLGDYQYTVGTCAALLAGFDRLWGGLLPRMFHIAGPTHDWTGATNEQGYRQYFAGTCPGQKTGPSALVRARGAPVGPGDIWSRDVGHVAPGGPADRALEVRPGQGAGDDRDAEHRPGPGQGPRQAPAGGLPRPLLHLHDRPPHPRHRRQAVGGRPATGTTCASPCPPASTTTSGPARCCAPAPAPRTPARGRPASTCRPEAWGCGRSVTTPPSSAGGSPTPRLAGAVPASRRVVRLALPGRRRHRQPTRAAGPRRGPGP